MCYNVKSSVKSALERTKNIHSIVEAEKIEKSLLQLHQLDLQLAKGFEHPQMVIYHQNQPNLPLIATWGLIPKWNKTNADNIWNKTLNARIETIDSKNAFKQALKTGRCLIPIDGFYEHQHILNKKIPHYIHLANNETMYLAGVSEKWFDSHTLQEIETFSIVTRNANSIMQTIHNNPNVAQPRMPFILANNWIDDWLCGNDINVFKDNKYTLESKYLNAYSVAPFKQSIKNKNPLNTPHSYADLTSQGKLF